ncbi:BREX-1 system adenine-specific DNA-methyltransferase PglX [Pseudobutyrivibrio sp.]|uniref:BREX-1 system adenine-specific DNA-methyltransferase PglX n=1 Tax=Pseudobutyrivibrio sp. TaxID=2014367 RepID=UPI0025D6E358|nr:BREX-1 system adenine-specific DNA-methyltransferase PglX [Pseudobutyrivibrio sp.]
MDKNAIKKYAIWARRELIEKVSQKALQFGIEEKKESNPNLDSIDGKLLSDVEKKQRQALIRKISIEGYMSVIEEVAYTWFNRFIAIRFMEVNGYLPSHVRVFSDENNDFRPQIMTEALHLDMECVDKERVMQLKQDNQDEELFRYLLIAQCNELNVILPHMFQTISDYTELLLPDFLLREGSVIDQLVTTIPEADWTDQVQIIGWLYQYYNTEPKEAVFAALKKNTKISKENIPAATQLFTPDWIVRYMVDNSLGKLWLLGHRESNIVGDLQFYIRGDENEEFTIEELVDLKPENIKCIDPCMGSGHILSYLFDVLIKIYESSGYSARDAASLIVKNNIYGLDIDERAAQLASFALMMKARQYDRRFFTKKIYPNVDCFQNLCLDIANIDSPSLRELAQKFSLANEYGSLLDVSEIDVDSYEKQLEQFDENILTIGYKEKLERMIAISKWLNTSYDVVVTNPPYMGANGMSPKLSSFVKKFYPDSKGDLFAVFIERCNKLVKKNRFQAMITQHAWMFLSTFENLRSKMYQNEIISMAHLGPHAFEEIGGEVVQTTAFVQLKGRINNFEGTYVRLVSENSQEAKKKAFLDKKGYFKISQNNFSKIPSCPCAYWISNKMLDSFEHAKKVADISAPKVGLQSGNSEKYFRQWTEVRFSDISFAGDKTYKWYPCVKGGEARKWYGNNTSIINWENDGEEIRAEKSSVIRNPGFYFKEGLTWTKITSIFALRYFPPNMVLTDSSVYVFPQNYKLMLGCLNSKVAPEIIGMINPTLNFVATTVGAVPIVDEESGIAEKIVEENIAISKDDWDNREISWDFKVNPIIGMITDKTKENKIEDLFNQWNHYSEQRFNRLKNNEEELNKLFIEAYGLADEISPDENDDEITIRKANLVQDMKELISYGVGCIMGRYSPDREGICFAGGEWNLDEYKGFIPDYDGIVPVTEEEYFSDDIVEKFIDFIRYVFGDKYLEDNLSFIANALGTKGTPRERLRKYFCNEFFTDHCKMYSKKPIYWLFDSGKKNGFKCLIYIHRYQADTLARIRTDYVHELQSRYRTAIDDIEKRIAGASGNEIVKFEKNQIKLKEQDDELHKYEEQIHHLADQMISINLDDGVKKNYEIFKDVLAKIK